MRYILVVALVITAAGWDTIRMQALAESAAAGGRGSLTKTTGTPLAQKPNRRGPKSVPNPLSKNYKGFVVKVNSVEAGDSFTDPLTHDPITALKKEKEVVKVNISVRSLGKEMNLELKRFGLIGVDGTEGSPGVKDVLLMFYPDRLEQTKDVFFAIKKGTELKVFEIDDLSFDLTKIKVKRNGVQP
ncbi:MAG: hypothetical protein ABJC05_06020 [Pyrinomonadaceae bacterium]